MGAIEFGHLLSDRMEELQLSQNRLASRIGELPDGRIFDATQIRMLREGRRRLDHMLVGRLIEVLGWDQDPEAEARAWLTAGLAPEGATIEDYREIVNRHRRERRADRTLESVPSSAGVASQQEDATTGTLTHLRRVA